MRGDIEKGDIAVAGELVRMGRGSSMEPQIIPGDRIHIGPPGTVRPGDVVVFRSGFDVLLVCHRVLSTRLRSGRRHFLLSGDSHWLPDGWIASDRIEGRVVAVNGSPLANGFVKGRVGTIGLRLRWGLARLIGHALFHPSGRRLRAVVKALGRWSGAHGQNQALSAPRSH